MAAEGEFGVADFVCLFELATEDCGRVEAWAHDSLKSYAIGSERNGRPMGGQEWFKIDVQTAIKAVQDANARLGEPAAGHERQTGTAPEVVLQVTEDELRDHEDLLKRLDAEVRATSFFSSKT